jgi:ribonuclease HI
MSSGQILTFGTDGSCLRNPDGPTGWAYICDDGTFTYGGRPSGTNQIGELMAILTVLRHHPDQRLEIQSDSAYAIGCSSTWKVGWQRAGYVRKTGPIANLDIIKEIHALLDSRAGTVTFVKVKAHLRDESVHPLNVRADDLAGRGARAAQEARCEVEESGVWPGESGTVAPGAARSPSRPPVADLEPSPALQETGFLF